MAKKIAYSEPAGYFPKEIRKKYKLGEYAETATKAAAKGKKTADKKVKRK